MLNVLQCSIGSLIEDGSILVHKDGNHGSNYPRVDDFGIKGLPFLTAKSLSDWRIDFQCAPRLSEEKASTFKFGFVQPGDVLLSHNATVGRVAVVPEIDEKAVIGTSLTQFRVNLEKIDPWFLALYFSGNDFQNQLSFVMSQTTRNQVPITEQRRLPVQLPSLSVQRAISETLRRFIEKIALNRQINETLEAMARAIFKDWFVDFGPTRAKMEGRAPYLAPDIWSLFPDRLDDEGKPEGWLTAPIKSTCITIANGGTPKRDVSEYWEGGGIPWLTSGEVRKPYLIETHNFITEAGFANSSAKWVKPDATVVALYGATAGQVAFVGTPLTTNQAVCALTPNQYFRYFNFLFLSSSTQTLAGMATGSAQQNLSKGLVEEMDVTLPSTIVARTLDQLMEPLFALIIENEKESVTLTSTRDLLLPRLMSGEIRIKDAEKIVEVAA
jgi:type I restriction enzyme S subunit